MTQNPAIIFLWNLVSYISCLRNSIRTLSACFKAAGFQGVTSISPLGANVSVPSWLQSSWCSPGRPGLGYPNAGSRTGSQLPPHIPCCQHFPASPGGGKLQPSTCSCARLWQSFVLAGVAQVALSWAVLPSGSNVVVPLFPSIQHKLLTALSFTQTSENLGSVGFCHFSAFLGNTTRQPLASCSTTELNGASEKILDCACFFPIHKF